MFRQPALFNYDILKIDWSIFKCNLIELTSDENDDETDPFISIIFDANAFGKFTSIILNKNFKCNLINKFHVIPDKLKYEFIDCTLKYDSRTD